MDSLLTSFYPKTVKEETPVPRSKKFLDYYKNKKQNK